MSSSNRMVVLARGKPWHNYKDSDVKEQKPKAAKKAKPQQSICYPLIAEGVEFTDDPYWKDILTNASYGVFPRHFHFADDIITFKVKSKIYRRFLDAGDAEIYVRQIISFMQEVAGCFSPEDVIEQTTSTLENENKILTWKDLKQNSIKEEYISKYITMVKNMVNLTDTRQLEKTINMGILSGVFDNNTIEIAEQEIKSIDGLVYDGNTNLFSIDITKFKKKKCYTNEEDDSFDYKASWRKYILALKRHNDKHKSACLRIN